jgi:hypothetical protein
MSRRPFLPSSAPRATRYVPWLVVALALSATPAFAQLGKLKKLGADMAKDAAKEKLEGKKDTPAKAAEASSSSSSSKRNTELVIDEDRVALVVASMQPMLADAVSRREARAATAQHEERSKASRTCLEAAQMRASANPMSTMESAQKNEAQIERFTKEVERLSEKMSKAVNDNDVRTRVYVTDTLTVMQVRMSMAVLGSNCPVHYTPAAILDAQIKSQSRTVVSEDMDAGEFDPPAAAKENLSRYQFGLLRERIAIWALKQEDPTFKAGKLGIFTPEEEAALQANAADIKKLTPLFKDGSLRWSTWGDLTQW